MPRPVVHAFTERVYAAQPQMYRDADEANDWALLRFLSLLGDQAGEIQDLAARIDYVTPDDGGEPGDTSDLTDPSTADFAWLPWLAQLVGTRLPPELGEDEARDAVRFAPAGYRAGTTEAVAAAARTALTGTQYASVYDHSVDSPGDGTEWDVLLVTATSETPDVDAVLAAVVAKHAKPAGVVLNHRAYTATWAEVMAANPTWGDVNGKTWAELMETGI